MSVFVSTLQRLQPGRAVAAFIALASLAATHAFFVEMGIFRKSLDVKGKHCYITGGSSGLGHALALELVKRGAHVTIIARGQARLDAVKAELETHKGPSQIIQAISADLTSPTSSSDALEQAVKAHGGKCPEHIYLCAGHSLPQFFIDASPEELKSGLDGTYWVSAYTAHLRVKQKAATKMMVSQRVHGKIVFVSSFVGYISFPGYSPYAPGKYALRALADTLRTELVPHNISVHIFMPASIRSAGWENEELRKPRITKQIEEGDEVLPAGDVAESLIIGIEKGYYQITNVLVTDLMRVLSKGNAPYNNIFMDMIYLIIALVGVPIWSKYVDYLVKKDAPEVRKELKERGFYADPAAASTPK